MKLTAGRFYLYAFVIIAFGFMVLNLAEGAMQTETFTFLSGEAFGAGLLYAIPPSLVFWGVQKVRHRGIKTPVQEVQ